MASGRGILLLSLVLVTLVADPNACPFCCYGCISCPTAGPEPAWELPPTPPSRRLWDHHFADTVDYQPGDRLEPSSLVNRAERLQTISYTWGGNQLSSQGENRTFRINDDHDWYATELRAVPSGLNEMRLRWGVTGGNESIWAPLQQIRFRQVADFKRRDAEWTYVSDYFERDTLESWAYTVTNLRPNTTYEFSARARNWDHLTWSASAISRTKAIPPWIPPRQLEVFGTTSRSTVAVKWSSAANETVSVDEYSLYYGMWDEVKRETSWKRKRVKGSDTSTQIRVTENKKYFFAIEAQNELREGMLSSVYRYFT